MRLRFASLSAVLAIASAQALAGPLTISADAVEAFTNACAAGAVIRGQHDFDAWLAADGARPDSPLAPMSAGGRRRFLAGLVFQGNDTIGLDTADLEADLTMSQAYRVLALFGWQWAIVDIPEARIETDADRDVDAWRAVLANPR